MQKRCQRCGRTLDIDDWYEYIRRKYCKPCAEEVKRMQKANYDFRNREKHRKENKLIRQINAEQEIEIERLKAILKETRDENKRLEKELKHENWSDRC